MRSLPRKLAFCVANTGAVLVALYVAFARDLERPYWAMFTVFIIAKPTSGAVRSKAVYRFFGTLAGAALSLLLIPPLVQAPVLLCLATSAWVGVCLYISLLDRTPRSYAFMLAGYTATIVGLAVVNTPLSIFDTAVSRIEEISLGILCGSLAHTLFFPVNIAQELNDRIAATIKACAKGIAEALVKPEGAVGLQPQARLATVVTELHVLYTHVAFDTSDVPRAGRLMQTLQHRLAVLLPHLSNALAALEQLHANGGPRAPVGALLERMSSWARSMAQAERAPNADLVSYSDLRARFVALSADTIDKHLSDWQGLLEQTVVTSLGDLAAALEDSRRLASALKDPAAGPPQLESEAAPGRSVLYRDRGLALLSACAAAGATLLGCFLWIQAAWPEGAVAAQFAAIGCSLFATFDNPAKVLRAAVIAVVLSLLLGAVYEFAIFPRIDGFASLALVLTPVLMLFSLMQTSEKLEGAALVLAIGFSGSLALQSSYSADFATFINSNTAEIVGLLLALVTNLLFRTIDPTWNAVRISRAGWRSVSHLAYTRRIDTRAWTLQMFDRVGLVTSRLRSASPRSMISRRIDGLRDIRVGLNVVALRDAVPGDGSGIRAALDRVLDLVAQTYEAWTHDTAAPTQASVARSIDAGISELVAQPASHRQLRGLVALASLRLDLAPVADPYSPALPAI
jgi:uncharacterized membrane protein YccC